MFLVTSPDQFPPSASFKVPEDEFEALSSREGFRPAPYMARNKWVYLDDIRRLSPCQWQEHISTSYRLVAAKLPKKVSRQLGLSD